MKATVNGVTLNYVIEGNESARTPELVEALLGGARVRNNVHTVLAGEGEEKCREMRARSGCRGAGRRLSNNEKNLPESPRMARWVGISGSDLCLYYR